MRCKRCGEPLDPMDTHCPVCGRAVGARKKAPAPKKNDSPVVRLPQLDKFTHAYARDMVRSNLLQLAALAAAVVILVLAVLMYRGIGSLQDSVNQLRLTADAQLQQSQNQTEPTWTTEPETEPDEMQTEPSTEPAVVPLGQQSLTAALSLYRTDNGTYAAAAMNPSYATAWVNTVREGSARRTNAAWILQGTDDRLTVNLHDSYGSEEAQAVLTLSWSAEGSIFGAFSAGVCAWEWRVPGSEWESLPADCAATDLMVGTSRLSLTADRLTTLLGQYEMMELRCQVSLNHPDGGSLRIITDGITVDGNGPVTAGSMLD